MAAIPEMGGRLKRCLLEDSPIPIYEYICQDCGVLSEISRKITQRDDAFKCPDCNSSNTEKKMSIFSPNIAVDSKNLKGTGKGDFDRLVGASAEKRWESINAEKAKRDAVRQATGTEAVGRTPGGGYAPLPKHHLEKREQSYKQFAHAKKHATKVVTDD